MGKPAALRSLYLLHNGVLWLLVLVRCEEPLRQSVAVHSGYCPWECMTFVQMWPGSFCVALTTRFECVIPKTASNWTIHGLWPSDIAECCHYWYLFPSDLNQDLMTELNRYWPNFINLSNFQFWEKEWKKHGTCAGCVETLNSPNKYFRTALSLHTKYNIDRRQSQWENGLWIKIVKVTLCRILRVTAFQRNAVIPSCQQSYQLSTLQAALQPNLGDQYKLQCVTDTQGRQILVQIKVSLHTDFSTGCIESSFQDGSPYKPCQAERRVFYFPPNHENPRNPCP
ncbi:ribonuclease Oy-like isoform X3 [Sceloporus undulatus]|uniref:ribonuclease Oy-like isoform X3 n=1 Tax=Sceloporus undulatus TaxID=8520 RepID=UPI001C4C5308|nr:ribonuclease Oy-like isoform X3 [Sceloporus undulatus]